MSENDSFDENKMLTEIGRKNIRFGLRDKVLSQQLFLLLRHEFSIKINQMQVLRDQAKLEKDVDIKEINQKLRNITSFLFDFVALNYKDIATVYDFIEIVNGENLRIRDVMKAWGEEISKNKTLSEDSINVIVEMINKVGDNQKFTDLQVQNFIDEFRSTLKFTKRKYEDEAKDTEKPEDVEKSENE